MLDKDTFAEFFRHNLNTRSRTSKGASDTSVSPDKPQLIGDEDYRIAKVAENTELLIDHVWQSTRSSTSRQTPERLLALFRQWAELNSRDLFYWEAYTKKVEEFVAKMGGDMNDFDPLYRTWDSDKYHYIRVMFIHHAMQQFAHYMQLVLDFGASPIGLDFDLATILGTADYLQDGSIHPWADACGRTSVAVVMFAAVVFQNPRQVGHPRLPRYPDRSSLYKSFDQGTTGAIGFYTNCLVEV